MSRIYSWLWRICAILSYLLVDSLLDLVSQRHTDLIQSSRSIFIRHQIRIYSCNTYWYKLGIIGERLCTTMLLLVTANVLLQKTLSTGQHSKHEYLNSHITTYHKSQLAFEGLIWTSRLSWDGKFLLLSEVSSFSLFNYASEWSYHSIFPQDASQWNRQPWCLFWKCRKALCFLPNNCSQTSHFHFPRFRLTTPFSDTWTQSPKS